MAFFWLSQNRLLPHTLDVREQSPHLRVQYRGSLQDHTDKDDGNMQVWGRRGHVWAAAAPRRRALL